MTLRTWAPHWRNPPKDDAGWQRSYQADFLLGGMSAERRAEYKQANPGGVSAPYTLGPYLTGDTYPEAWYAHDSDGARIGVNGFGKMRLANLNNPEAVGFLVDWSVKKAAGYGRVFIDSCGAAPADAPAHAERIETHGAYKLGVSSKSYVSAVPVNPKTGKAFTRGEWIGACVKLIDAVGGRLPGVVVNGLQNADNFGDTQGLLNAKTAAAVIAELWLRKPQAPGDFWPTPAQWDAETAMVPAVHAKGKVFLGWVKIWSEDDASDEYRHAFARYAAASLLLVGDGYHEALNFMPSKDVVSSSWQHDADLAGLRAPIGTMTVAGVERSRRFATDTLNATLTLNLATHAVTVVLDELVVPRYTPNGTNWSCKDCGSVVADKAAHDGFMHPEA